MNYFKRILKTFRITAITVIAFILCFSVVGCTPKGTAVDFVYFNTPIHIETHGSNLSENTQTQLKNLFSSLENEFSVKKENSITYRINCASALSPVNISERYADVFTMAKEYHAFTNGLFNPAVYPLVKLWQFSDYPVENFILPSHDQISTLLGTAVDFNHFTFDRENLSVTKNTDGQSLDLGGILKGYAIDLASQILLNAGHTKGYINVGSSSLYILSVSSLGIRHPRMTSDIPLIISVNLENACNIPVSTSGDYEKYYTVNNKIYNHIINASTGYPSNTGVASVTIMGASGAFGDAVTTAMCLMEHDYGNKNSELINFINKLLTAHSECSIYAVYIDGDKKEIITNKKQGEDFTLHDQSYSINKI